MPKIKAKATFRNKRELPGGVIHPGETAEVRGSYAKAVVTKGLAEIVDESEPEPEPDDEVVPRFAGVDFASDAALNLAVEGDLWEEDFEGVEQTGKTGYTTADVEAIIEAQGAS